tara:strand:- start:156 stop:440 length:285 start_codon:yes stop_codon:yes gene_type:complete
MEQALLNTYGITMDLAEVGQTLKLAPITVRKALRKPTDQRWWVQALRHAQICTLRERQKLLFRTECVAAILETPPKAQTVVELQRLAALNSQQG